MSGLPGGLPVADGWVQSLSDRGRSGSPAWQPAAQPACVNRGGGRRSAARGWRRPDCVSDVLSLSIWYSRFRRDDTTVRLLRRHPFRPCRHTGCIG